MDKDYFKRERESLNERSKDIDQELIKLEQELKSLKEKNEILICKELEEMQEQKIFKELQDNKSIEDAVLIMNPKHKDIVIKSGLKCCILWSHLCPENTTYMVTDKQLKENFKKNLERNYKQCCEEKCSLKAESEEKNG